MTKPSRFTALLFALITCGCGDANDNDRADQQPPADFAKTVRGTGTPKPVEPSQPHPLAELNLPEPIKLAPLTGEQPIDRATQDVLGNDEADDYADSLAKLLKHPNPRVRSEAIGLIEPPPGAALKPLAEALVDPYESVRRRTTDVLAEYSKEQLATVADAIIDGVNLEVGLVSSDSIELLAQLGKQARPAVPVLVRLLMSNEFYHHRATLSALEGMSPHTKDAFPALVRLVETNTSDGNRIAKLLAEAGAKVELMRLTTHPRFSAGANALEALGYLAPPPADVVAYLLDFINDSTNDRRSAAIRALGHMRPAPPEAIQALLKAAEHDNSVNDDFEDDWDLRLFATIALGEVQPRPPEVLETLKARLEDRNKAVRSAAVTAIGKSELPEEFRLKVLFASHADEKHGESALEEMTEAAWPLALKIVQDKSIGNMIRIGAARFLETSAYELNEATTAQLAAAAKMRLDDAADSLAVRAYLACALRKIDVEHPRAVDTLIETISDGPNALVRSAAINELAGYSVTFDSSGEPRAVPALMEVTKDENGELAEQAIQALGNLGPTAAPSVPLLCRLASTNSSFRLKAIESLGDIGAEGKQSIPVLFKYLNTVPAESNEADTARTAMSKILARDQSKEGEKELDAKPIVDALAQGLAVEREWSFGREAMAEALANLGEVAAPATPQLIRALEASEVGVRRKAAEALLKIGPKAKSAQSKLVQLVSNDEDDDVRQLSVLALGKIQADTTVALPAYTAALDDDATRRLALNELQELGPQAAPSLDDVLNLIDHPDDRNAVIKTVAAMGSKAKSATVELARVAKTAGSSSDRGDAGLALLNIAPTGRHAIEFVGAQFKSRDTFLFFDLRERHQREWVEVLTAVLGHQDADVRRAVLTELSELDDESTAVPGYLKALEDKSPDIRLAAIEALRDLGGHERAAAKAALTLPIDKLLEHESIVVRHNAMRAVLLSDTLAKRAIPELTTLARDRNPNYWVPREAAYLVWRLDTPAARRAKLPLPKPAYAER